MIAHMVERVRFEFDVASAAQATALQERISQFRSTGLEPILDGCLSNLVPEDRFLRLGTVELDLGAIDSDQLEAELALRIESALKQLLPSRNRGSIGAAPDVRESGVPIETEQLRQLEVFLQYGMLPWSAGVRTLGLDRLLISLIETIPGDVRCSLIGRDYREVQCKRLVSQFAEATLRRLLRILMRDRQQEIALWIDGLQRIQEQRPVVESTLKTFKFKLWESVLGFLLERERPATDDLELVRATLPVLARHYRVDCGDLASALMDRVEFVPMCFAAKSVLTGFLKALRSSSPFPHGEQMPGAGQEESVWSGERNQSPRSPPNELGALIHMLQYGKLPSWDQDFAGCPAEQWLASVLTDQPVNLISALKCIGDRGDVIQRLVQSFTWDALSRLIGALEPGYAGFVETYLLAGERFADQRHAVRMAHWRAVLGWLLDPHGQRFEAKAFVYEASYRSARRLNMSHGDLLAGLLDSIRATAGIEERFVPLEDLLSTCLRKVRDAESVSSIPELSSAIPAISTVGDSLSELDESPASSFSHEQLGDILFLTRYFLRYGALPQPGAVTDSDELQRRIGTAIATEGHALGAVFLRAAGQPLLRARMALLLSRSLLREIVQLLIPDTAVDVLQLTELIVERYPGDGSPRVGCRPYAFVMETLLESIGQHSGRPSDAATIIKPVLQQVAREEQLPYAKLIQRLQSPGGHADDALARLLTGLLNEANVDSLLERAPSALRDHIPAVSGSVADDDALKLPDDVPYYVCNAGVVLLWPFLGKYFETLGMLRDGRFRDAEATNRAVYLLQSLVSGDTHGPEFELLLNKIICGLDPAVPLGEEIEVNEKESQLSMDLLHGVSQNWTPLRNTSTQGLRASFLQRDGRLVCKGESWSLTVTTKSYDVLLDTLPWRLSPVRLSWMQQVLYVTWR